MASNNISPPPPPPPSDVSIACQLSSSLQMLHNVDSRTIKIIEVPNVSQPKLVKFSQDGQFLGCIDCKKLTIFQVSDYKIIFSVNFSKEFSIQEFSFSPKSTFIATFEQYTARHKERKLQNINICRLDPSNEFEGLTNKVAAFTHTQLSDSWEPQWTRDEQLFVRQTIAGLMFRDPVEWKPRKNLELNHLACFQLAKQYKDVPHFAVFIKGHSSIPCSARIYQHCNLEAPITNKTFFNADSATLHWNHSGTALLVIAQMESSINYYGGQSLYYLNSEGFSLSIELDKKGPIYSTDWHPSRNQFAIVYGLMPSRARIYNHKCEPLITLPEMHRNIVKYNPQGNLLCFAGFGGLRGVMEFWDVERRVKISSAEATDTTYCEWCPDGSRFLTATLSPRLFEGNGFKVWDFTGKSLSNYLSPEREHFWSISWRPAPPGAFPPPPLSEVKGSFLPKDSNTYVPPSLRDRNAAPSGVKLDEERGKKGGASEGGARSDPKEELEKKLRGLRKKLKDIDRLKEQSANGKALEANQQTKIASEAGILEQIATLELREKEVFGDRGNLEGSRGREEKDTTPNNWRQTKTAD